MADIADSQVTLDAPAPQMAQSQGNIPDNAVQLDEDTYGGMGQGLAAVAEGALRGTIGPAAPFLERAAGITAASQRGRAEAHPVAAGVGEVGALVAGAMTGTGEAALLGKAGHAAQELTGLANLGKEASYASKVGSSAVQQAVEMAVLQGSDETSKMLMQDPDASAQNAIAHIGLAGLLGGAGGAFMTGAVSPLWKATLGPKLEEFLNMTKNHLNGGSKLVMPDQAEAAAKTLGIDIDPIMRSGMSADERATGIFSDLRRAEHPEVINAIDNQNRAISNSVMDSLGITPESVAEYSDNQAGHDLSETFQKELKEKYDPQQAAMNQRDAEAAPLKLSDDARLAHAGNIIEKGISDVGTDSPYFKDYQHYADRLLAKNTVGEVDKLRTEILGRMKAAGRSGDDNAWKALSDIRNSLGDFQTSQIEKNAINADSANLLRKGPAYENAQELIARRNAINQGYAKYAGVMDDLTNHLGIGDFRGTGKVISKLTEKLSPEELMRKFSVKGNSDLIPYLQEHFPETFSKVIENERKQLVKPAILAAAKKGDVPIDAKKLGDIVQKNLSGKQEYVNAVLPKEALAKIEAAKTLANAIPNPKDSGTPAGLAKIFAHMPAAATAAISWALGHGPIGGYMLGEAAQRLGKDAPEAIKLGYLRYLASDQPVKAEGFKAMVDFIDAAQKSDKALNKAAGNLFKPGVAIMSTSQMPSHADIMKLDKMVADNQKTPGKFEQAQNGDLGHYLYQHQAATTTAAARQLQYLQSIKPQPFKPGPLDKEIPPSKAQDARYNRALMIAQDPKVVLNHIKNGTLQTTDIQDIDAMYPDLYKQMQQKVSNAMISQHSEEGSIPYHTRIGLSLFLAQPLDNSMTPSSIVAAQPKPQQPPPQGQNAPPPKQTSKKSSNALNKEAKSYRTPGQASEEDRANRD